MLLFLIQKNIIEHFKFRTEGTEPRARFDQIAYFLLAFPSLFEAMLLNFILFILCYGQKYVYYHYFCMMLDVLLSVCSNVIKLFLQGDVLPSSLDAEDPHNDSFKSLVYFMLAPTLCYQVLCLCENVPDFLMFMNHVQINCLSMFLLTHCDWFCSC